MSTLKYILFGLFICLHCQNISSRTESVLYMSTERPSVDWYDTKIFQNFTLTSHRVSRQDLRHYVSLYVHTRFTCGNNLKLDFFFYQFLTNRYQPSFVEMHFGFCDMLQSDTFFGLSMRNALMDKNCPFPPGKYDMKNMTIPYVPKGFPFTKGRIYCNLTLIEGPKAKHVLRGSIDIELKVMKMKRK